MNANRGLGVADSCAPHRTMRRVPRYSSWIRLLSDQQARRFQLMLWSVYIGSCPTASAKYRFCGAE